MIKPKCRIQVGLFKSVQQNQTMLIYFSVFVGERAVLAFLLIGLSLLLLVSHSYQLSSAVQDQHQLGRFHSL